MKCRMMLSVALVLAAAGTAALAPTPPRRCHRPPPYQPGNLRPQVICRSFNCPKWTPIDFHYVSIPIGDEDSDYEELLESINAILPGPEHMPHPDLGVGPGAPHEGPYTYEMAWGVRDSGFFEGRDLRLSQFRNGHGACLAWLLVPEGACGEESDQGSSPDFDLGDIISNAVFPIHFEAVTFHNGHPFSMPASFDIPALDGSLTPPFDVDGHSHIPNFLIESADFATDNLTPVQLTGVYRQVIRLTDAEGNGWNINTFFVVVQPYR